mmetsp:Transcript_1952/g.5751  ORF Transcript_1952/g.5751 Transcript_1952/m.5751 type:complete len:125 (+) Transcript_1952:249-623(+)
MHPSLYVFFGALSVGLAMLLMNRQKNAAQREGPLGNWNSSNNPGQVTVRGEGAADPRIVQQMLNEVESRLAKIRRMPNGDDRRRAVAALRAHYNPSTHKGSQLEAAFRIITEHIEQRLSALRLS